MIIGNFGYANYNKVFVDEILQWRLIHRTEDELRCLMAVELGEDNEEITSEENGINLLAIATER
jgi:extracellular factor (EF) 3-hydroxypalmitic acid methyl ester biosynthesis protein